MGKGHLAARMYVGAGAYFVAALALLPGVLLSSLVATVAASERAVDQASKPSS